MGWRCEGRSNTKFKLALLVCMVHLNLVSDVGMLDNSGWYRCHCCGVFVGIYCDWFPSPVESFPLAFVNDHTHTHTHTLRK